jgi:uncharacterized protein
MVRYLTDAVAVRPSHQDGNVRVEGHDEDAFTLGLSALETLVGPDPVAPRALLTSLHLVGGFPERNDWELREALGLPRLQIHHHLPGPSGWSGAMTAAAHEPSAVGSVAVVGGDVAAPRDPRSPTRSYGAAMVAARFGTDPGGLEILGRAERGHPSWRRPDATEWSDAGLGAIGARDGVAPTGELLLVASALPPVLVAVWAKAVPGMPARSVPLDPPSLGPAPTAVDALALHDLAHGLAVGAVGLLAHVEPDRTTFLAVRKRGPVRWSGAWADPGPGRPIAGLSEPSTLDHRSEGAYVPFPTYLENLPSRWRLAADRCESCSRLSFPARRRCQHCGEARKLTPVELARHGLVVEATTTVSPGAQPSEFDDAVTAAGAYDVVLARIAEGVRVTLQVADVPTGTVRIGDRVSGVLRRLYPMEGEWRYGLKAVPDATRPPPVDA